MKTKDQRTVSQLKTLAFVSFGGVPEWLIGPVCKTVLGAQNTHAGSNPAPSASCKASPVKALTSTGEMKRTAEAARIRKFSIRLLAVELKGRFHSDLSFLPDRMPQIR
jgi:hypothetical protein